MVRFKYSVVFNPAEVTLSVGKFRPRTHSGMLLGGDWDLHTYPFHSNILARAALQHWREGVSWEDTGVIEHQLRRIQEQGSRFADGMVSKRDILRRYQRLDDLFDTVARTGRLPEEANRTDGIYVHIDRTGHALFGHRGVHRFVITHLLQVPEVVAQLGLVHPHAPQALRFRWRRRAVVHAWTDQVPPPPRGLLQRIDPRYALVGAPGESKQASSPLI